MIALHGTAVPMLLALSLAGGAVVDATFSAVEKAVVEPMLGYWSDGNPNPKHTSTIELQLAALELLSDLVPMYDIRHRADELPAQPVPLPGKDTTTLDSLYIKDSANIQLSPKLWMHIGGHFMFQSTGVTVQPKQSGLPFKGSIRIDGNRLIFDNVNPAYTAQTVVGFTTDNPDILNVKHYKLDKDHRFRCIRDVDYSRVIDAPRVPPYTGILNKEILRLTLGALNGPGSSSLSVPSPAGPTIVGTIGSKRSRSLFGHRHKTESR